MAVNENNEIYVLWRRVERMYTESLGLINTFRSSGDMYDAHTNNKESSNTTLHGFVSFLKHDYAKL